MKSIRLNFFYNLLLSISRVVFPLITAPYVARVLSPDGVGLFNFSNMYASYFAMFAVLGIPTYGMREVAKVRDDREKLSRLVSELVSIQTLLTIASTVIFLGSIALVGMLRKDALIFVISGLVLYLSPVKTEWFFAGEERFGFITMRQVLVKALCIVSIFVFVKTRADMIIYVTIYAIGNIVGELWTFFAMLRNGVRLRFTLKGLGGHMKPVLILFASSVAISVYTMLDTLMLGFISEYSEVAYYNCASNISRSLLAAVTSFSAVAVPRMSYYLGEGNLYEANKLVDKGFSVASFLAIPAAVGLACVAPTFTPLFYGDQYGGAVLPLQIMAFVLMAIGLNNITAWQVLVGIGKDKLFLYSVLAGASLNLVLNAVLIPLFGAVGASSASVAAEFLILGVSIWFMLNKTEIRIHCYKDALVSFAISLSFLPLIWLMGKFIHGWWLVGSFVVTGFCIYVILHWIAGSTSFELMKNTAMSVLDKQLAKIRKQDA